MKLREEGELGECAKALPCQGGLTAVLHDVHNVARMGAKSNDGLRAPSDGSAHIIRLKNVPAIGLRKLSHGLKEGSLQDFVERLLCHLLVLRDCRRAAGHGKASDKAEPPQKCWLESHTNIQKQALTQQSPSELLQCKAGTNGIFKL